MSDMCQPTATQAELTIFLAHLSDEQMHGTICRNRGDRVFAVRLQLAMSGFARADLGDIACLPQCISTVRRSQLEMKTWITLATRV